MAINLATMHGFVVKEIASKRTLRESMDRIIAKCAKGHSHDDWKKLAALPYEDLDDLREWIEKAVSRRAAEEKARRPMVRTFQSCLLGQTGGRHLREWTRFDPGPDDNSWAVGPDWWPESRYAHSAVLSKLYKIACRKDGLANDAEYPLCLAYGGLAVRDLLRGTDPLLFLGSSPSLGIAVGFDSGDFVLVGMLRKAGLVGLS